MRQKRLISSLIALSAVGLTQAAHADPVLRKQVDQRGDFVLFGNALGHECATNLDEPVPTPLAGSTVSCQTGGGQNVNDTGPDAFWRADWPMAGQATADNDFTAAEARSTAVLTLPANATITYARIYWAGLLAGTMSTDPNVRIERPGAMPAVNELVTADEEFYITRGARSWYQSTADVTALLQGAGAGAYRISNVGSLELDGLDSNDALVGWVMVVFYARPTDPPRNLALFDGLDLVQQGGATVEVDINGFLVPNAGFDAKLGVIAYEGENQYIGDQLLFNGTALTNAANPVNNFFNSTRSNLGALVSTAGDLPRLTGGAGSMAGMDIDVVNVKPQLQAGDTSATIGASSVAGGDSYALGAFVTSISTFKPDFTTSGKTFVDVNGAPILPGDVLEYTVTVTNTGNDASANTVMTDELPAGITYVPGSISISSGDNSGAKTDAAGDDQANFDAAARTIRVRLGQGANATQGGSLEIDESTVIKFRVTVDANATGSILNQAIVTASGELGAPSSQYPTDGNGNGTGVPPTEAIVDECATNTDCAEPEPVCDTTASPNVCVGCLTDTDCKNPTAPECLPDNTCGCVTNCDDADGDGIPDDTEVAIGTDPDDADSDDDGVADGDEPSPGTDTDGDGSINALDPDSDNDGLFDGTELGLDCSGKDTAPNSSHCIADADAGDTMTDPLDADTDDGGVKDGSEDVNHDGAIDDGETDPTVGHGDDDDTLTDGDGDGLTDDEEDEIGSDPGDADTDDDGVIDGEEANPADDSDGDGIKNVSDPDSDNDGLYDGTELGKGCDDAATDLGQKHCVADGDDGATTTSPIDPDTDHGGVTDGNEDTNLDGVKDDGETDPTLGHGDDDGSLDDSDGDGLSDGTEETIGTDPTDADSDDDGVTDGDEPNFADDTDGDGDINASDPDSDDDGVLDGTELGRDCSNPATNAAAMQCTADGDEGETTTNPLDADTDDGGVNDGDEDADHDGVVDSGERDPNDASDDGSTPGGEGGAGAGGDSGVAGSPTSGNGGSGASATGGSGAAGSGAAGSGAAGSGTAGSGTAGSTPDDVVDGVLEGGGCSCRTPASTPAPLSALVSLLGVVAVATLRRRARR